MSSWWAGTTTASVSAVTDSQGNVYRLAIGPTRTYGIGAGSASQSIYYANNIVAAAAGTNTVTATLTTSANGTDVRIAEYIGLDPTNPFDVAVGTDGIGTALNSSSVTTTNATDLLVGATILYSATSDDGTGYTQRLFTANYDTLEDRVVTSVGSYQATAAQDVSGYWVMQMAAFKAAATGGDTQAPTAPTNLTPNVISSTQINLSWTAASDNVGVTSYQVESCSGASCSNFAIIGTPTTTSFSNTGLTGSTVYRYRVLAKDAAGNSSAYSSIVNATTNDGQAPTAPTNLVPNVVSSTQINLSWTASTDNVGVTSYQVQRCQGAGCASFATVGTVAGTTFNNTGLTAATTYRYQVIALDAANNLSPASNIVTATTQTPPTTPTGVTVTAASATEIDLAWSASMSGVGMAGYVVERCHGASCNSFAQIGSLTANTVFYDSPLTAGTSYSYRFLANDTATTESANSTVLTQVTLTAGSCD